MLSSVVKTVCNGPANNALFVLDKERKKPDAEGQKAEETLLVPAYISFFHYIIQADSAGNICLDSSLALLPTPPPSLKE